MRSDSERGLEFAQIGSEGLEPVSQLLDLAANRGDLGGPGRRQRPGRQFPACGRDPRRCFLVAAGRCCCCGKGQADLFQLLGG